ncbi:hypothetical protein [Acuticoccus mangrovi]|uniref:OmpA-like domain-containing protein n=1 Tax=Acuticoccus mangrovi TaxID=2796142 RepID=A0A934IHX2_9HYPH|nr:hypothetical protein [Acuticoccus mangrovi]MBJ3775306.1 hypothetical protein [Acuticoccus mangrovi]
MIDGDALHEEDEGYFASMTDIMVGLLFVFIIVIMFFALQITDADPDVVSRQDYEEMVAERDDAQAEVGRLEVENAKQRETIAELEQTADDLRAEIERLKAELLMTRADRVSLYLAAADARRTEILRSIQSAMRAVGIDVEIVEEQGVVRLPNDLLFASGSYTIGGGRAASAVAELAAALARVLPCFTRGPASQPKASCNPDAAFVEAVFVEGHTDRVPVAGALASTVVDNLGLSARRAETTYRRLLAVEPMLADFLSVDDEPVLNVAAYGETRPIRGNTDLSRDRRIDLRILMHTPRSDTLERVESLVAARQ